MHGASSESEGQAVTSGVIMQSAGMETGGRAGVAVGSARDKVVCSNGL